MTIYYAIRKVGTEQYLPRSHSRARATTFLEPTEDEPPRLYTKYQAAANSLNCWLKGIWTKEEGERTPSVSKSVPERDGRDMEIVTIRFQVIETMKNRRSRRNRTGM